MSIRKIGRSLGIYLMLMLLVISLSISGFGGLIEAPLAHALDSLNGSAKWYDPRTILYTDDNNRHVQLNEQGKDVAGGDTPFVSNVTVAQYHQANKSDTDFCDGSPAFDMQQLLNMAAAGVITLEKDDARNGVLTSMTVKSGDHTYDFADNTYESNKIAQVTSAIYHDSYLIDYDINPAMFGHVTDITGSSPFLFVQSSGHTQPGGGCIDNGSGRDSVNLTNGRPPLPVNTIGSVHWGDQSGPNEGGITVDNNFQINVSDAIDYNSADSSGQDSKGPLGETSMEAGAYFEQSENITGNKMVLQLKTPPPAPVVCSDLTPSITVEPYQTYTFAQLHIPQSNGRGACAYAHFWLSIDKPWPPVPTDFQTVQGTWITANQIKIVGAGLNDKGVADGTVFTGPKLIPQQGSMTLTAPGAQCTTKTNGGKNSLFIDPFLTSGWGSLTYWALDGVREACKSTTVHIAFTNVNINSQVSNLLAAGAAAANSLEANLQNCPIDGNSGLNWLLCPLWALGVSAVNALSGIIQNLLYVDTGTIFDPNSGFEAGFNTFRNIGMSLLIVAGLIMVVAQAAGLEIFSAHTIRKALPRIVIAAIGMALAWPLLEAVIIFFNDIGTWINSIILSVVPSGTAQAGVTTFNVWSGVVDVLTAGTIVAVLGALGLFSLLITFLVGLLIGAIILIARQLVILVCVLLAPLAIASAVLPGTDVVWKTWRKTLLGALVMFPMIMGFLGAGAAMGQLASLQAQHIRAISNGATNGADLPWDVMAIGSVAVSLLALPSIFSMLTGFMGTIANGTQGLFKGFLENQKKFRAGQVAKNMQAAKAGSRYGKSWVNWVPGLGTLGIRGLTNVVGAQIGAGGKLLPGARAAQLATNRLLTPEAAAKLNSNFAANMDDADFLNAMVGRPSTAEGRAKAALVPRTRQFRAAAFIQLGKTGQFNGTGEDAEGTASSIGGLNGYASSTLRKNFQDASRANGRLDQANKSLQASIAGMRPEDLNGLKGAAIRRIFTPQRAGGEAPIAEMIRTGNYVDNNGRTQTLSDGQRTMLGRVYYEASYSGRVAGGDQQAVRDGYLAARGGAGGAFITRGEDAARRSKIGV